MKSANPLAFANLIVDSFLHFAVPLFIVVSGLVLARKYWTGTTMAFFYRKRLLFTLPQYILFSAIFIIYSSLTIDITLDPITIGKSLLFGTAWYHLYFILVIVQLYLLYPLIIRLFDGMEKRGRVKLLLISTLILQIGFILVFIQASVNWQLINVNLASYIITNMFVGYMFYFILGVYIGRNFEKVRDIIKKSNIFFIILLFIITGIVATVSYSIRYFNMPQEVPIIISTILWNSAIPILTLSAFILLFSVSSKYALNTTRIRRFIDTMGTFSFGIYLVHPIFIDIFTIVVRDAFGLSHVDICYYPLLAILTIITSLTFVKIVLKLPHGNFIIGIKPGNEKEHHQHNWLKWPRKKIILFGILWLMIH